MVKLNTTQIIFTLHHASEDCYLPQWKLANCIINEPHTKTSALECIYTYTYICIVAAFNCDCGTLSTYGRKYSCNKWSALGELEIDSICMHIYTYMCMYSTSMSKFTLEYLNKTPGELQLMRNIYIEDLERW